MRLIKTLSFIRPIEILLLKILVEFLLDLPEQSFKAKKSFYFLNGPMMVFVYSKWIFRI